MVRIAKTSDTLSISNIHYTQLNYEFLSKLGKGFLYYLYNVFIQNKEIITLVYEDKGEVLGFLSGAKNFDKSFKTIILNNFFKLLLQSIIGIIRHPKLLKNAVETVFYINKQPNLKTKAELISIAVNNKYHRKGIGKRLIFEFEKILISQKVPFYKVSVNKNNGKANSFYKSLGFEKGGEYLLYGKKINLYLKKIS